VSISLSHNKARTKRKPVNILERIRPLSRSEAVWRLIVDPSSTSTIERLKRDSKEEPNQTKQKDGI